VWIDFSENILLQISANIFVSGSIKNGLNKNEALSKTQPSFGNGISQKENRCSKASPESFSLRAAFF
jgi:hypothetical protein